MESRLIAPIIFFSPRFRDRLPFANNVVSLGLNTILAGSFKLNFSCRLIFLGLSFWGTTQNEPVSFLFNKISVPFGLNIATGCQLNKLAKGANLIVKF